MYICFSIPFIPFLILFLVGLLVIAIDDLVHLAWLFQLGVFVYCLLSFCRSFGTLFGDCIDL